MIAEECMRNQSKTILLLAALSALLVGIGGALAPGYIYVFGILALAMNVGAYFYSDRIVLATFFSASRFDSPDSSGCAAT